MKSINVFLNKFMYYFTCVVEWRCYGTNTFRPSMFHVKKGVGVISTLLLKCLDHWSLVLSLYIICHATSTSKVHNKLMTSKIYNFTMHSYCRLSTLSVIISELYLVASQDLMIVLPRECCLATAVFILIWSPVRLPCKDASFIFI
jgi:hypothetical protein